MSLYYRADSNPSVLPRAGICRALASQLIFNIYLYLFSGAQFNILNTFLEHSNVFLHLKARIKALPDGIPLNASTGSEFGKNPPRFHEESSEEKDDI